MSSFAINTNVFFGKERHEFCHRFLSNNNYKTIAVIVDSKLQNNPVFIEIIDGYKKKHYQVNEPYIIEAITEPSYDLLDKIANIFRNKEIPDLILVFGGGTVIDIAKGVAILLKNPGKGIDYRGMNKVENPGVPLIVYPSTAGTGSEVTWTASFVDFNEKKKLGINGKNVAPLCGVLDPNLVAHCPFNVALGSGLDAMVHASEAVSAKNATMFTTYLGSKAFGMIYKWLPICLEQGPENIHAWENMQIAAYVAGVAMMNAGGGPASGISYPLGVYYNVPHGIAGGVFLSGVFELNIINRYKGYEVLYEALSDDSMQNNLLDKSLLFLDCFNQFYEKIKGPRNLRPWNCIGDEVIKKLTDLTLEQRKENLLLNPVPLQDVDVRRLITQVCN